MGDDRRRCCCGVVASVCTLFIDPQNPGILVSGLEYGLVDGVSNWVGVFGGPTERHFDGTISFVANGSSLSISYSGRIRDNYNVVNSEGSDIISVESNTFANSGIVATSTISIPVPAQGSGSSFIITDDRGESVTITITNPGESYRTSAASNDVNIQPGVPGQVYPSYEFVYRPGTHGLQFTANASSEPFGSCVNTASIALNFASHSTASGLRDGYGSRLDQLQTHAANGIVGLPFFNHREQGISGQPQNPISIFVDLDFPNTMPAAGLPVLNPAFQSNGLFEPITGHATLETNGVTVVDGDFVLFVPKCGKIVPISGGGHTGCIGGAPASESSGSGTLTIIAPP